MIKKHTNTHKNSQWYTQNTQTKINKQQDKDTYKHTLTQQKSTLTNTNTHKCTQVHLNTHTNRQNTQKHPDKTKIAHNYT